MSKRRAQPGLTQVYVPESAVVLEGRRRPGEVGERICDESTSDMYWRELLLCSWPLSLLLDSIEMSWVGNSGDWSDVLRRLLLWRRSCEMKGYC